jgi:WD40 repeat protein
VVPAEKDKTPAFQLQHTATSAAHDDVVQSLAFSPDGKRIVSGGFRSVRFWDPAAPQKMAREISAPFLGRQTALLFLADGKRILVADSVPSQLGRIHEITLEPETVKTFDTAHLDSIFSMTLSADGKRYATTSADKLIVVRDSRSHEIVKRLEGHTGYVMTAAFSPAGDRLASGGDDEEIKVWNLETGKKVGSFASNRSGPLYGLTWLVDPVNGKRKSEEKDKEKLAAINDDLIVAVPESGKPAAFTELKEHEGEQRSTGAKERAFETAGTPLFALAFDRESLWTYAGGEDGKLRVWDEKGKLVQTLEAPVPVQTNPTPNPVASTNE